MHSPDIKNRTKPKFFRQKKISLTQNCLKHISDQINECVLLARLENMSQHMLAKIKRGGGRGLVSLLLTVNTPYNVWKKD